MAGNQPDRAQQFDQELAALKIKSSSSAGERRLADVSLFVIVIGVLVAVLADTSVVDQAYTTTTGLVGVAITVAGGALYLRYSLGQYLRYWLLRQIHEQRVQTDRIVSRLGETPTDNPDGGAEDANWPRVWPDQPGSADAAEDS